MWRSPEPREFYDVIIIGGGGHGLGTAYYLAKEHGLKNIAVIEKGWLGGGNTGRNTTIIRSNYLWDDSAHLYEHSLKLWENLSSQLNYNVMFSQRGVMNLAHNEHDIKEIKRRISANNLNGIDSLWLSKEEIQKMVPIMNTDNLRYPVLGASFQPREVSLDTMRLLGVLQCVLMRWVSILFKIAKHSKLEPKMEKLKELKHLKVL